MKTTRMMMIVVMFYSVSFRNVYLANAARSLGLKWKKVCCHLANECNTLKHILARYDTFYHNANLNNASFAFNALP